MSPAMALERIAEDEANLLAFARASEVPAIPPVTATDIHRAVARAEEAFSDRAMGIRWLKHDNLQLGQRPPILFAGTPKGYDLIETVLIQIEHGIPA